MAAPVLKWAGGKRQLLDELQSRFPKEYNHFHEPFLGGGALFFELEPEDGTINDTNTRLTNFYRQVRDNPEELIDKLESFDDPESRVNPDNDYPETSHTGRDIKNYYYQQRARFNKRPYGEDFDPLTEAALLMYLNRTCYNGLYRENNSGGYNVPIGDFSDPDWVQHERIHKASTVLTGTDIRNDDFTYILDAAEPGDLVYFDPPYKPMSSTAYFTDYSADGFDQDDQKRLLEVVQTLAEQDVHVIVSNSGVMYEMYEDAGLQVDKEGATRAINSDGDSRGEVDEIIATTVEPENRATNGQTSLGQYNS